MAALSDTRVAVLATQLCARVPGGTGRYVEELIRALGRTQPDGATLAAVAPQRCERAQRLPVAVRGTPRLPGRLLARLWERGLPPRLSTTDVVHAPTVMVPSLPAAATLLVTIHDVVPWTHPETLTRHGVAFHRRMGARASREAEAIVTPTEAVAVQVRELLEPRCPVVAVHSGVTVRPAPGDAASRRQRFGVGQGPYVLFVGTAEPRKGLDILIAALSRPDLRGAELVVVGPRGWGDIDVAELARAAGMEERVRVTGHVDEQDLAALYQGARAMAMPSRAEGFGFPVLEAMGHGVPVVVSDDAALVEVSGGATVVVPVGDPEALAAALALVTDAGPDREHLIRKGRVRVGEFDWDRTAARMWTLYASVLAQDI